MTKTNRKIQLTAAIGTSLRAGAVATAGVWCSTLSAAESGTAATSSPGLTWLQALILGIVEGATEYLPVSSTGHLLIVQNLLGLNQNSAHAEAADSLAICIQGGAILAVLFLYTERLRQMIHGLLGRDTDGRQLLINLLIAFAPAAVAGLLLRDAIREYLFGITPIAAALIAGAILILLGPRSKTGSAGTEPEGLELRDLKWHQALGIGCMQCVAMWPGFSRSLATILGCRWIGLRLSASVEFSFLLGLITLSAATAWESLKGGLVVIQQFGVVAPAVALVAAFIAAAISVKFMVTSLGRFGLVPFAWYRIALALACLLWVTDDRPPVTNPATPDQALRPDSASSVGPAFGANQGHKHECPQIFAMQLLSLPCPANHALLMT